MDGMGQAGGDVALSCPLPLPIRIMLNCSGFVAGFCITETRKREGWLAGAEQGAGGRWLFWLQCSLHVRMGWIPPPRFYHLFLWQVVIM